MHNLSGSPTEASRELAVPRALARLSKAIASVDEALAPLAVRLEGGMQPSTPNPTANKGMTLGDEKSREFCPISVSIEQKAEQIEGFAKVLHDWLRRLEL